MRILTLSTGNFDQTNSFNVEVPNRRYTTTCTLKRDYHKQGDGVYWAMNPGSSIKSSYTDEDRAEQTRLRSEEPVRNGDVVMIDGEQYRVRVLGQYSDCAIFDKI